MSEFDLDAARAFAERWHNYDAGKPRDFRDTDALATTLRNVCKEVERLRAERDAANAKIAALLKAGGNLADVVCGRHLTHPHEDATTIRLMATWELARRAALASAEVGEKETTK